MKKGILLGIGLLFSVLSFAQYTLTNPVPDLGNPGGLNTEDDTYTTGWTQVLGGNNPNHNWSGYVTVPFPFSFDYISTSILSVSTSGVVSFFPFGYTAPNDSNLVLPQPIIPPYSACVWGLHMGGDNDKVLTKVFGTAPNRQFWIKFFSASASDNVFSYWSIVLEEGSNNIYIVDAFNSTFNTSLTVGVQFDSTQAAQVPSSPSVIAMGATAYANDNYTYTFIPYSNMDSLDLGITEIMNPIVASSMGPTPVRFIVQNRGWDTISSCVVQFKGSSGSIVTDTLYPAGLSTFSIDTLVCNAHWNALDTDTNLRVWIKEVNGLADDNAHNDSLSKSMTVGNHLFTPETDRGNIPEMLGFEWADIDDDGDMDITGGFDYPRVLLNKPQSYTFTECPSDVSLSYTIPKWRDFDNDGELELLAVANDGFLLCKMDSSGLDTLKNIPFTNLNLRQVEVFDYNKDGLLDIIMCVEADFWVFKNMGNLDFAMQQNILFPSFSWGSMNVGDYDEDGYPDLILTGSYTFPPYEKYAKIWKNNNGQGFTEQNQIVLDTINGPCKWIDYDNDGDLDLMIIGRKKDSYGYSGQSTILDACLYTNNGNGSFTKNPLFQPQKTNAFYMDWGDVNQDGVSDFAVSGVPAGTNFWRTDFYLGSTSGNFTLLSTLIPDSLPGSIGFADIDNDGDLDFYGSQPPKAIPGAMHGLYRNNSGILNLPPSAPLNLSFDELSSTLSWSAASDDHTPANGLSYNVYIKDLQDSNYLIFGHANESTGYRWIMEPGNAGHQLQFTISHIPLQFGHSYEMAVQAIDNTHKGSAFTTLSYSLQSSGNVTANHTTINCGEVVQLGAYINFAAPLNYQWTSTGHISNTQIVDPFAKPTQSCWYKLEASHSSGFSFVDSVYIEVLGASYPLAFSVDQEIFTAPSFNPTFYNETPDRHLYNFTWDFGDLSQLSLNDSSLLHTYMYNGSYTVSLFASDANQCTDTLSKVDFIQCSGGSNPPIGILDVSGRLSALQLAPNPNSGFFTLQWEATSGSIAVLEIVHASGKIVHREDIVIHNGTNKKFIQLQNAAKGMYLVRLQSDDGRLTRRFVVY